MFVFCTTSRYCLKYELRVLHRPQSSVGCKSSNNDDEKRHNPLLLPIAKTTRHKPSKLGSELKKSTLVYHCSRWWRPADQGCSASNPVVESQMASGFHGTIKQMPSCTPIASVRDPMEISTCLNSCNLAAEIARSLLPTRGPLRQLNRTDSFWDIS